jgi:hypothetical protein
MRASEIRAAQAARPPKEVRAVCSETQARDLVSIHRRASCSEMNPGMWSRLPWDHATRTYHPGADFNRRASKEGSAFSSFMISP